MRLLTILLTAFLVNVFAPTQASSEGLAEDQAKAVQFAETASLRALNFDQGDLRSLMDAEDGFTAKGWGEFMKVLDGWLDDKGAPTFSSKFIPAGKALNIRLESGVLYLTIPGDLKQVSRNRYGGVSSTIYRGKINIQLTVKPLKIEHLQQITCGSTEAVNYCM